MRAIFAGMAVLLLAACGNRNATLLPPKRTGFDPAQQAPPWANTQRLPSETIAITAEGERELKVWERTVLEYADNSSLIKMRQDAIDVLKLLDARYREAGQHEPYVMIDYRRHLAERIAYEAERLRLIDAKISQK